MIGKTKKEKAFEKMKLTIDKQGKECLEYDSIVGLVRDYSPWTISEYKSYKGIKE